MGKTRLFLAVALVSLGGIASALPGLSPARQAVAVIPPVPAKGTPADFVIPAPMAPEELPEQVVLPTDGGAAATTDQTIAGRSLRVYCSHPATFRVSVAYPDGGHVNAATERSHHIAADSPETVTLWPTQNAISFHLVNGTSDLPSDGGPWCEVGQRGAE